MKKIKCKYCGKEIPGMPTDKRGRKNVKAAQYCRGTNHYRLDWNANHKKHKQEQDRLRYLKGKEMSNAETDEI